MKLKHYLLIVLTVLLIAFFQPFIMFLGNVIVIGAAVAYIYSDLSPDAQEAYEQRLINGLRRIRDSLRHRGATRQAAKLHRRGRLRRLIGRRGTIATESIDIETAETIEVATLADTDAEKAEAKPTSEEDELTPPAEPQSSAQSSSPSRFQ